MRLIYTEQLPPESERVFQLVFDTAVRALGIEGFAAKVKLYFVPNLGEKSGGQPQQGVALGVTSGDDIALGVAKVAVEANVPFGVALYSFAHELQHVAQLLKGDLSYSGPTVCWKGKAFDGQTVIASNAKGGSAYEALPWEQEAFVFPNVVKADIVKALRARGDYKAAHAVAGWPATNSGKFN